MAEWNHLPIDAKCEIVRRMSPESRLLFWMANTDHWDGLFEGDSKSDIEYIARIWCVRDDIIDSRIKSIVGATAMKQAAALLGRQDWLDTEIVEEDEVDDVAFWMAVGRHTDLLRSFIAASKKPPDGSRLWTAAAYSDDREMAEMLVECCIMPSREDDNDPAYMAIGELGAKNVAGILTSILDLEKTNVSTEPNCRARVFDSTWCNMRAREILKGCMIAGQETQNDARHIFRDIMDRFIFSLEDVNALLFAAVTSPRIGGTWYVHYWLEDTDDDYDQVAMVDYVSSLAILRKDDMLLDYIVQTSQMGYWELTEKMLWAHEMSAIGNSDSPMRVVPFRRPFDTSCVIST